MTVALFCPSAATSPCHGGRRSGSNHPTRNEAALEKEKAANFLVVILTGKARSMPAVQPRQNGDKMGPTVFHTQMLANNLNGPVQKTVLMNKKSPYPSPVNPTRGLQRVMPSLSYSLSKNRYHIRNGTFA